MRRVILVMALMLSLVAPARAAVIRVPADQPAIQNGIDAAADGDEVVVADGIYTGYGNRDISFHGKAITVRSEGGPTGCIIDCEAETWGERYRGFRFHDGEGPDSVLQGFTIRNGLAPQGGAILCEGASPTITGNVIIENGASSPSGSVSGGGICAIDGSPLISGNIISGNIAGAVLDDFNNGSGGGISCIRSSARIENNLITDNYGQGWTSGYGGGIKVSESSPVISNCTFSGNQAFGGSYYGYGGALYCYDSSVTVENSIFWHDDAVSGGPEIALRSDTVLTISWSDLEGGQAAMHVQASTVDWGPGMIDADPRFAAGPLGDFYLGQTAAGQPQNSPCVDAGNPAAAMIDGTTRTDAVPDSGVVDMGYHHPLAGGSATPPDTVILSGPSGSEDSPVITFTFTGSDFTDPPHDLVYSWILDDGGWTQYGPATWATISGLTEGEHVFQVRARDTDGLEDPYPAERTFDWAPWDETASEIRVITGPGPGPYNPPLVRTPQGEWLAYGAGGYGVNVACGDISGDGFDYVLTGPGPGRIYGPHVRGWFMSGAPLPDVSFMAYGTHRYGVNVAAADLDGDGRDEIITGAGPGAVFGPHVRGWTYTGSGCEPVPGVSYFAYGTPKWGVNVTGGDITGDGRDEIITGAGPGAVYGAHVRGWTYEGGTMVPLPGCSFFAYGTPKWGVNVGVGDIDGDGIDEIITGPGPGATFSAHIRAFDYNGGGVSQVPGVSFIVGSGRCGAEVSAADISDDGVDDILVVNGAGPDEPAVVTAWRLDGGEVSAASYFLAYGEWMNFGGTIAGMRNEGPPPSSPGPGHLDPVGHDRLVIGKDVDTAHGGN